MTVYCDITHLIISTINVYVCTAMRSQPYYIKYELGVDTQTDSECDSLVARKGSIGAILRHHSKLKCKPWYAISDIALILRNMLSKVLAQVLMRQYLRLHTCFIYNLVSYTRKHVGGEDGTYT